MFDLAIYAMNHTYEVDPKDETSLQTKARNSITFNVRGRHSQAQHAQSDNDFLSKMSIALKEADESDYWFNLLHDNGYLTDDQFSSLDADNQRILRLLNSIVKSTKERIEKSKEK